MNKLVQRVQRLEATVPDQMFDSAVDHFTDFLSDNELCRLHEIVVRAVPGGDFRPASERDAAEIHRLWMKALERQHAGWQRNDKRMQELNGIDRAKHMAIWRLIWSLRARHPHRCFTELDDADNCNLADLELEEIESLARIAKGAISPCDLEAHASTIERLILANQRVTVEVFRELIFNGALPSMGRFRQASNQLRAQVSPGS